MQIIVLVCSADMNNTLNVLLRMLVFIYFFSQISERQICHSLDPTGSLGVDKIWRLECKSLSPQPTHNLNKPNIGTKQTNL